MHRERACADHHLRKAVRDLLPEPAIRLLLPGPDQPAPVGEYRAARNNYRPKQTRAAGRCREQLALSDEFSRPADRAGRIGPPGRARHHDTDRSLLQVVVKAAVLIPRSTSFPLISPVAKSHQPLWKWLEGTAPAIGAVLIITANVNPATAQQGEAPQRAEIAIPMNDQGIRAAGILTARVSPAQGRS